MKKILSVIILALYVVSCAPIDENKIQVSKDEIIYVKLDRSTVGIRQINVIEFTYNDHQYFWMRDGSTQSSCGGPVHDPDCEKCLEMKN